MYDKSNLIGQKFGRLTVLKYVYSKYKKRHWLCQCKCGNVSIVSTSQLKSGKTKSCGCLRRETTSQNAKKIKSTHHLTNTRIYSIWRSMKKRCYLSSNDAYKDYGARGIKVCDKWKNDFISFYNWAMANGYKEDLTLDRINVNGNYEPNNCRWANWKVQQNNKRNNIFLTYNNITKNIYEWSEITGIKYCTIWWRYNKGWNTERILSKGVKNGN